MTEKINVLGIEMDCLTAKEAMLQAMQFIDDDSVDTIEILSMNALLKGQDNEEWKEMIENLELVLPGEADILKAADVADRVKLKETENGTFLKLFMKYLQKNQKKVFLLAESDEEIGFLEEAVGRYSREIRVSGRRLIGQNVTEEEGVVNEINGTETDCILSVLASPYQEQFISRNRSLLNVKMWFGCSAALFENYAGHRGVKQLRHFFLKRRFFWRAGKEKN